MAGSAADAEVRVELVVLGDDRLEVGLNQIGFRVTDLATGLAITDASIAQAPLMTMMSSSHACPYTQPSGAAGADGLFEAKIVFGMASNADEVWDDAITVTPAGGAAHALAIEDLAVAETEARKMFTGTDGATYQVTLNWPDDTATVGDNAFTLTVHHRESMMSFPADEDLTVEVTPYMPDMGHGSMGNVDPTHTADGEYVGSVHLSMDGYWVITFDLARAGTALGTVEYGLTL